MTTFIVRIELHPSDSEKNYSDLHRAMENSGFSRIYTDRTGIRYHLPSSEYCLKADSSADAVRDLSQAAVSKVTDHFMVLVSETKQIAIGGLIPVQEKPLRPDPVLAA